jgi:ankyrin repeat protein
MPILSRSIIDSRNKVVLEHFKKYKNNLVFTYEYLFGDYLDMLTYGYNSRFDMEGSYGFLHMVVRKEFGFDLSKFIEVENIDVNIKDGNLGFTPLHRAVYETNIENMKVLLSHPDIDTDCYTREGFTPLHLDFHSKNPDSNFKAVEYLLNNTNINVNTNIVNTPLVYSSCYINKSPSYAKVVNMLLDKPDIDVNLISRGSTALMQMVSHSDDKNDVTIKIIKRLLSHPDIDVNIVSIKGDANALVCAIFCKMENISYRKKVVSLLLAHPDIDVNVIHYIPSIYKVKMHIEIFKLFLKQPKFDPRLENIYGFCVLDYLDAADIKKFEQQVKPRRSSRLLVKALAKA